MRCSRSTPRPLPLLLLTALALAAPRARAADDPAAVRAGGAGDPVLLVLGPEADAGLYLEPGGRGLARSLARRGHAVWIAPAARLDDAVEQVLAASGAERLALVGHGLGGTACYLYLVRHGGDVPISALVTLGAPAGWTTRSPLVEAVVEALGDADRPRFSRLALLPSPLPAAGDDLFSAALTNVAPDQRDELLRRAREAGATQRDPALDDLAGWVSGAADLPRVSFPVLAACGERDRLAPCEEAWRARDALGEAALFHKFGSMNLDGLDFGHLDLVLADRARRRVDPVVARFLQRGTVR